MLAGLSVSVPISATAGSTGETPEDVALTRLNVVPSAGIAVTSGKPTKEILGIIKIDKAPEGRSYDIQNKVAYGNKKTDDFSLQLNAYAHIKEEGGKEVDLWLQNVEVLIKNPEAKDPNQEWLAMKNVDVFKIETDKEKINIAKQDNSFKKVVEYYADSKHQKKFAVSSAIKPGEITMRANEDLEDSSAYKIHNYVNLDYATAYNGRVKDVTFPEEAAVDISIKKVGAWEIQIDFSDIPIKNGNFEWEKRKVIASASYFDPDGIIGNKTKIKSADIEFSKDQQASMVAAGGLNAQHYVPDKFDAKLGIYSVEDGNLVPLKLGDTVDHSTMEGITGVQVKQLSPNWVEVTTPSVDSEAKKVGR